MDGMQALIFEKSVLIPLSAPALSVYLFICLDTGLPNSSCMMSLVTRRAVLYTPHKIFKFHDIFKDQVCHAEGFPKAAYSKRFLVTFSQKNMLQMYKNVMKIKKPQ